MADYPLPPDLTQAFQEHAKRLLAIRSQPGFGTQFGAALGGGLSQGIGQGLQQGMGLAMDEQKRKRVKDLADKVAKGMARAKPGEPLDPETTSSMLQLGVTPPSLKTPTRANQQLPPELAKELGVPENLTYGDLASYQKKQSTDATKGKAAVTNEKADFQKWKDIDRLTNPTVAPRGAPLGTAGLLNQRADRALQTLKDSKNITPQRLNLVVTDIAGIMQGGAPTDVEMKQQAYGNVWNDLANLKTKLSGSPSTVNTPAIAAELKRIVTEIKAVDNNIIKNNLETAEATFSETIARNPKKWAKMKESILKLTQGLEGTGTSPAGSSPLDALIDKHLGGN